MKTKRNGDDTTDCLFLIQYRDPNFRFVFCEFDSYNSTIRDKIPVKYKNLLGVGRHYGQSKSKAGSGIKLKKSAKIFHAILHIPIFLSQLKMPRKLWLYKCLFCQR
ncbi:ZYRO0C00286p [Zygosaccharomyces rouxii]|uniref:ZYRO0C00286p n=1 Tax=Zygosaccharomyces rouxii (strain ATCC 2623 / CBS 732 / NBRC 1130 / NCYC 568 / NRRL Y-229) TaxID=559307 RepID=C5DSI0_ZYGRC|nr:uncharacterized protein ZYRO0C00286g [Zygosaccharomyces rouxii]KAH9202071.1 hypothetical protein LQ764DRAFT_92885 [Zygosaccharomyces rouxii]CAR26741.1 ZYRO0C00286p [Zygosaccharomyces rouxii]